MADVFAMHLNTARARPPVSGLTGILGRLLLLALVALGGSALLAVSARADLHVPGKVQLGQAAYRVSEAAGSLHVAIVRTNPVGDEWVRYGVRRNDAVAGVDFDTIPNSLAHFGAGQTTYSFDVRVYDQGMSTTAPVHAVVYLFGSYPQRLGARHEARITILRNDPVQPRNNANPLGLPITPNGNVLFNAPFYVAGTDSEAGQAAARTSDPVLRARLQVIANSPGSRRIWFWNQPDPRSLVSKYLQYTQLRQPGSVVQLSTYSLVHGRCGMTATPAFAQRYRHWIDRLADGIGNYRVVLYLEVDSLITAGCLTPRQRHVRFVDELAWAVARLERQPHVAVYLDGGAADAVPWPTTANWLAQAGVKQAQGFFLNATHFDWTTREVHYGQRIAARLGGIHFVVDTHGGGRGPLVPGDPVHQGNEVLCNPPGRGLGPLTTNTGYKWTDAFSWFHSPGNSGGSCRPGAPPTATFWPQYAAMLVQNRMSTVTGPRYRLIREGALSTTAGKRRG